MYWSHSSTRRVYSVTIDKQSIWKFQKLTKPQFTMLFLRRYLCTFSCFLYNSYGNGEKGQVRLATDASLKLVVSKWHQRRACVCVNNKLVWCHTIKIFFFFFFWVGDFPHLSIFFQVGLFTRKKQKSDTKPSYSCELLMSAVSLRANLWPTLRIRRHMLWNMSHGPFVMKEELIQHPNLYCPCNVWFC